MVLGDKAKDMNLRPLFPALSELPVADNASNEEDPRDSWVAATAALGVDSGLLERN